MHSESNLERIIAEYIYKYGINDGDYQFLRDSLKKDLISLESYFQQVSERQKEIIEEIKAFKLNLVSVSEKAGVTRSTIYNNPEVLKVYISSRVNEIEEKDMFSQKRLANKEKEVKILNEYVENIRMHSVKTQALTDVIDDLEAEMKDLIKINQANTERIYQLEKQNRDLTVIIKEYKKEKILPINRLRNK